MFPTCSYSNNNRKQLRNSPTVQAHRKTFDIFLSTDEKGHFDPLSTKPQNQKPQSLKEQVDKPRSPAGTPLRGRAGTQYTPRRANDTSPDFPLNQSRMMYGSDDAVRTSTGRQKPGRGQDRSVGADRQGKPTYVSPQEEFYPTEESTKKKDPATPTRTPTWQERPTTPNNRTKEVATPPASRGSRGPFSRDLHSNYPSNSTNPQPIDNNNFESINTINTDDRDSVVMQPKRDRYGPARGLPRPSTNQPTLTPQRQIAQSPPKNYAGKPTKRPNELNLFSNEPAQHSRRSTPREDEYVYEEQEDVKSRQATPKQVRTPTQARTPTSEKGFAQPARGLKTPKETTHFNPFERPSHQDQPPKTPVRPKDHGDADSRSSSMTGESANKSPMHSSAMRPMKREDNLRVDRSLPFGSGPGSGSVYKEDFPVKARADTGQIAGKSPQTSGVRDSSETRVFGTIKNLKYNDIKTVYQNDFKEVVMPNFMKKDCPILSLPKPPKVITAGKMHVYYDEDENDWH